MEDVKNGDLYFGGIGDGGKGSSAWGWNNATYGLQMLKKNGKGTFEIKAVRIKVNGFEFEFTQKPNAAAFDKTNYSVEKRGFTRVKPMVQAIWKIEQTSIFLQC